MKNIISTDDSVKRQITDSISEHLTDSDLERRLILILVAYPFILYFYVTSRITQHPAVRDVVISFFFLLIVFSLSNFLKFSPDLACAYGTFKYVPGRDKNKIFLLLQSITILLVKLSIFGCVHFNLICLILNDKMSSKYIICKVNMKYVANNSCKNINKIFFISFKITSMEEILHSRDVKLPTQFSISLLHLSWNK